MIGLRDRLLVASITAMALLMCCAVAVLVTALPAPWSWLAAAVGVWLTCEATIRAIIWGTDRWPSI